MKLARLCYVRRNRQTLRMHRKKKANVMHQGKSSTTHPGPLLFVPFIKGQDFIGVAVTGIHRPVGSQRLAQIAVPFH
jgi:hypothetical protein